jgi:uncharacterized ferritin-like protein (DUF455 family)
MELREFAERVLFAKTLEEKLQCPEVIVDEHPGSALEAPLSPGRPTELRFKTQGSGQADFPGIHRLRNEHERGRLLHFFANHELLATELMALVLLRFPDAPAAFRRGVLQTLKDEQVHTRLYLERMRACGTQFGELPVSGYFWRCVSNMQNPMDYVAGLCLTFEQANLDFCRHFAQGFEQVGDADTANLLTRIYRDEIGHVAYGLKWFRRWKNPKESDWEAFCRQLKFPLSPQRAKGFTLNIEGRRAAGLDADFIAELNVYSQSKGRTPGIFVFNPFTEGYIAQGRGFTPKRHQAMLARDLANLPQFLCRQDDIVLLLRRPSTEFLSVIKQAGFPLPEFAEWDPKSNTPPQNLRNRKIGGLRPWAWGPDSLELLEPFFVNLTGKLRTPGQCYNDGIGRLYSKSWSAGLLKNILAERAEETWLCSDSEVGVMVNTLTAAVAATAAIRERGHHRIVVKECLGVAGQGSLRLWEPEILAPQRSWMENSLKGGRQLIVEPWLERELDFSIQLEMGLGGLKLCGFTGLINDTKGQFQANWAERNYARRPPSKVLALFRSVPGFPERLQHFYDEIFRRLEGELQSVGYLGPLGIDAFIYCTSQGDYRLKPIVEINPRYTMGRLTLELMTQVAPGCFGLLRLLNRVMIKAEGFDDFTAYAQYLGQNSPICLGGNPVPRIRSGVLCLNEPSRAQACLAVFQVANGLNEMTLLPAHKRGL